MKKFLVTLIIVFSAMLSFASETPLSKATNLDLSPTCTITAFGIYIDPYGGQHDVRCTQSGASCAEANSKAKDCRNQNVCRQVRCYGLIPDGGLGCRIDSICDIIE